MAIARAAYAVSVDLAWDPIRLAAGALAAAEVAHGQASLIAALDLSDGLVEWQPPCPSLAVTLSVARGIAMAECFGPMGEDSGVGDEFQIFVRTLGGGTLALDVSASDAVGSVKDKIYAKRCVPVELQRHVFGRQELEDGGTLREYSIEKVEIIPTHDLKWVKCEVEVGAPQVDKIEIAVPHLVDHVLSEAASCGGRGQASRSGKSYGAQRAEKKILEERRAKGEDPEKLSKCFRARVPEWDDGVKAKRTKKEMNSRGFASR
ncbi:unnamed protein product [Prorocentrum cordatum]|uniref:Ubiquitin-like domain-containing protein n=1 Tax=Prorocentrum cordatum TaxID=2364126 RepID=A0ABN9RPK1_9DINO|nr:unnamed protein product [Polarella glacialis]